MKNNLIITTAFNYSAQQLKPFLKSANQHVPKADIVIFSDNDEKKFTRCITEYNERARVIVPESNKFRVYLWKYEILRRFIKSDRLKNLLRFFPNLMSLQNFRIHNSSLLHVALARYIWTNSFLNELESKPDMILLSDSKDVFFQGDPFEDNQKYIIFGEEPTTIEECPFNSRWIKNLYTREIFEELKNSPVLCSGVTLGKYIDVIAYTEAMASEIKNNTLRLIGSSGSDQGIHNKILHMDKVITYKTSRNGDELIATLHYSDLREFLFRETQGLLTKERRLVKIVHQYDRHEKLAEWIRRIYK